MKKYLKRTLTAISLVTILAIPIISIAPASAALFPDAAEEACKGVALDSGASCDAAGDSSTRISTIIGTALNLISIVVGVIAIIVLIISGLRLILSQGDSNTISSARNAVLWALIGLAIVALAQVIVRYVLFKVKAPIAP